MGGTGVSQLFFKHQADGSITANGSTLIGQNWSQAKCPGHPLGSCVFQGRPDALGPYAGSLNPVAGGGDNPLEANNIPGKPGVSNSGESGASNLDPVLHAEVQHRNPGGILEGPRCQPHARPRHHLGSGYDPDITAADATAKLPVIYTATGLSASTLRALIAHENNGAQLGFLGSSYINVLQLNEALVKLR